MPQSGYGACVLFIKQLILILCLTKLEHTELEEDVESKANPNEETNNEDNLTESVAVTSTVQLLATRQQKLMERKSRIASLASDIVENPEENVRS